MKTISVVTGNNGKFLEIREILARHDIVAEQVDLKTAEEGTTLEERVLSKAASAFSLLKKPLIVDDTGLFFDAFPGFPGPFPKKAFSELGFEGIMNKLSGKERGAYFRTLVCHMDEKGPQIFYGVIDGVISEKIFEGGHESLPYDRIFIPSGYGVPFCLIGEKEKNSISQRGKAVKKFAEWFSNK